MSDFINNTYTLDKNFNDLGSHMNNICFAGKTEVTILDNLYRLSQLLHGRILSSAGITGGYRVYIPKSQLRELVMAYQTLSPYRLSDDLEPLIQSLRSLVQSTSNDSEIGVDSRIIMQMITVHNTISTNLKNVWEGVVSFRLISCSGFNKDITIDGKQQIFDQMLSKFSESEMSQIRFELERSGQLAGIKSARQVEMRDMIADLIFSRKDAYVTLHQLFHTTTKQRSHLRSFRTDIMFCPVDRYHELDAGLSVCVLVEVNKEDPLKSVIKAKGFEFAEFRLRNNALDNATILVAGSIGSGKYVLAPLQEIRVFGTSLSIDKSAEDAIQIEVWSDIREYQGSGASIVSLALSGKLQDDPVMTHFFFQLIQPVMEYLESFVRKVKTGEILRLCISKLADWAKNVFNKLQPGYIYSGWLLADKEHEKDRLLYVYMLTIMLPEFLLDPTFTFSDVSGTPPYIHDYGVLLQGLKKLFE